MSEVERIAWTAAEVEQARQVLVERGVKIDDDHLLAALKYGCGPDDDPAVRATVDAARPPAESRRPRDRPMSSATCNENCPCWGQPTARPRLCPICDHLFRGNGWDGIDKHYRTQHEKQTGELYEDWWNRICQQHKG